MQIVTGLGSSMVRGGGVFLLALLLAAPGASAATGYWTNNNTANWEAPNNWLDGTVPNAAGDIAYITNNITAARNVNITGTVTIGSIYMGDADGSHSFKISSTGTCVFDNAGSSAALTMTETSTNLTVEAVRVQLVSDLAISNLSAESTLTISSVMEGTGAVTVAGGKWTLLAASNSFGGGITLSSGVLSFGNNYAMGTGPMIFNGGSVDVNAARTTSNNNPQVWGGDFSFLGLQPWNMGTGAVTLTGNRTLTVVTNSLTVGGIIDDGVNTYGLTKAGGGTLTLTGANTHKGGTTLDAGTLYFNHAQALGTGPLTINGGRLESNAGAPMSNMNNNIQFWNGSFSSHLHRNLHLGTGSVTLGASMTVTIDASNELTVQGPIDDGVNTYSLTKSGGASGILTLGGDNTFGGGVVLNGGTLQFAHPGALGTGVLTINGGRFRCHPAGISNANNNAQVWNGDFEFWGGNALNLGTGAVTLLKTCAVSNLTGTGFTVGGAIDDGGVGYGLIKGGGGPVILTADNTFIGPTTIPTGTVFLIGAGSLANSSNIMVTAPGILSVTGRTDATLTLSMNQYLRGNGTVRGAVTNLGVVAPGLSAGRLSVTGTYSQAGSLEIELGGTTPGSGHDVLAVSSNATLGGTLAVSLIDAFEPTIGNAFTVLTAWAVSGTFDSTNLPAGSWTVDYLANAVVLTYAGAGGGAVLGVSPASLTFDPVQVGTTADLVFTVTNSGSEQVEGTATVSGLGFALQGGSPFSVGSGAAADVTIRFTPIETASYLGEVVFLSNGGDSTNVLAGSGYVLSVATNTAMTLVGGLPTFGFTLVSGALYRVQASTNLLDGAGWVDVTAQLTNQYSGGAIPPFSETDTTTYPRRVYRISSP